MSTPETQRIEQLERRVADLEQALERAVETLDKHVLRWDRNASLRPLLRGFAAAVEDADEAKRRMNENEYI